jgi:hypothetical protein
VPQQDYEIDICNEKKTSSNNIEFFADLIVAYKKEQNFAMHVCCVLVIFAVTMLFSRL